MLSFLPASVLVEHTYHTVLKLFVYLSVSPTRLKSPGGRASIWFIGAKTQCLRCLPPSGRGHLSTNTVDWRAGVGEVGVGGGRVLSRRWQPCPPSDVPGLSSASGTPHGIPHSWCSVEARLWCRHLPLSRFTESSCHLPNRSELFLPLRTALLPLFWHGGIGMMARLSFP